MHERGHNVIALVRSTEKAERFTRSDEEVLRNPLTVTSKATGW